MFKNAKLILITVWQKHCYPITYKLWIGRHYLDLNEDWTIHKYMNKL